jgi:MAF protein
MRGEPAAASLKLILASASPRRRELLSALGFEFEVVPSSVDEEGITNTRPERLARALALAKARDVASRHPDAVVLGADTVVVHRGVLLAKPRDADEVRSMLERLRGKTHRVITGVCLIAPGRRPRLAHVGTRVTMRDYTAHEIEASIARGDPFDKAGAYAIQDPLFRPVESYDGCYCNVVGLPLWPALDLLEMAGVARTRPASMPAACAACVTKPQALQERCLG